MGRGSAERPRLDETGLRAESGEAAVSFPKIYARALGLIGGEAPLAIVLVVANVAISLVLLIEPILFGRVVDALAQARPPFLAILAWALLGLFGIGAGVLVSLYADRLSHRRRLAAMTQAFERAIARPTGIVTEQGSGAIVRTMLAGVDALFNLHLGFLREHLAALVQIGLLFPIAFSMQPTLAAALLALAGLYALATWFVVTRTLGGQAEVERHHVEVFGRVGDVITNAPVVHAFESVAVEAAGLRTLADRVLNAQYPVLTWWAVLMILTRAASTVAMVTIFALGALLASRGEVSVGEIVSFVAFANLLITRLDVIGGALGRIFVQAPTLASFFALLDAGAEPEPAGAIRLDPIAGRVTFDRVSFRFPGSNLGVTDISFEVAPGQTAALVGRTGAGKSTALALLQRLRSPAEGRILIDGFDVATLSEQSLRRALAVVFQESGLFNRSIRDNLRLGRPGASDAEIEAAARKAEAHDFIMTKPGGYDFVIGERGGLLSGGERQRLAIARAILKDAPILLLDEATSALDPVTERRVKRALDNARRGRTTLIIAHRLSTVADADMIYVFDQGRIVERGDYRSLMNRGGLFAALAAESGEFTTPAAEN